TIVHNYMRFFSEQGRLRFPLYLLRVPRPEVQSFNAISEEEYRAVIDVLSRTSSHTRTRDLAMIMLLHDTGMRCGELVSLECEGIEEDMSAVIRTENSRRRRRVFWNVQTHQVPDSLLVAR